MTPRRAAAPTDATGTVPPRVPSVFHSPKPVSGSSDEKYATLPAIARPMIDGELTERALASFNMTVPAGVPSLIQRVLRTPPLVNKTELPNATSSPTDVA